MHGQSITKTARPMIIRVTDAKYAEFLHDGGRGYETDSGYWLNKDLCRSDREAHLRARGIRMGRIQEQQNITEPASDSSSKVVGRDRAGLSDYLEKRKQLQRSQSVDNINTEAVSDAETEGFQN